MIDNFGNLYFAGTFDGLAELVVVDQCYTGATGAKMSLLEKTPDNCFSSLTTR